MDVTALLAPFRGFTRVEVVVKAVPQRPKRASALYRTICISGLKKVERLEQGRVERDEREEDGSCNVQNERRELCHQV